MKRTQCFTIILFLALAVCARAQNKAPLKQVAAIPLPALHEGDFDHFTVDLQGHRLFLDAEENGKVEILDAKSNKVLHTIDDLKAPHSIVYRPDLNKLFIVDGDASEIKIYNATTYQRIGQIRLRIDADSMAYDPRTHYMYVVNAGRAAHTPYSFISIVNTDTAKKIGDIKINSNRIESLALQKSGNRLFANITGENAVGVINRDTDALIATWPLPAGLQQNVAMAFDEAHHRIFTVTREPSRLIVMDSDNGKVVAVLPCVDFVDDASFDPTNGRIYLAGNDFVDVFQEKNPDHYVLLGRVPGSYRAKTGIVVPQWHRYYLAVPRHGSQIAQVRVFQVIH
ncbi:MAG TPA: YncE family protein [Candidatus Dormibacteraeota bacterium]|nr:YncE family protein [Candidatus Dormibacteraeota bacterium]